MAAVAVHSGTVSLFLFILLVHSLFLLQPFYICWEGVWFCFSDVVLCVISGLAANSLGLGMIVFCFGSIRALISLDPVVNIVAIFSYAYILKIKRIKRYHIKGIGCPL